MFHTISTIIQKYPKTIYIALDIPMFILTFAFIVITGNRMDPESLALFNSGLGIFTVFTTIGNAMQTVIARRIAASHKIVGFRDFVLVSLMLTIVTCAPFFLPLHTLPNLKSIQYSGTVPFIVLLSANMAICVCRGILQGTERFYALWFAQATEHILRLVVLYLYMGEHISLDDAWFTAMMGGIGHLVLGILLIPPSIYRTFFDTTDTQIGMKKEIFAVIMSNFFLNFLLSCDVIIAGERLGELGGGYVTANKFGRLLYFVGSSVVVVILPFLARAKSTPEIQRKIVWGTMASIPIFALISPLISWILTPILQFGFPKEVVPSFELLSWTMFSNFALTAIQLFITWHIAQQSRALNWILGCCSMLLFAILYLIPAQDLAIIQITTITVWIATIILAFSSNHSTS